MRITGLCRNISKASLPGVILGLPAFFIPFAGLKENRVVDPLLYPAREVFSGIFPFLIGVLLLSALFSGRRRTDLLLWIHGMLLYLILILGAVSLQSSLGLEAYPYGSISLTGGFWFLLASSAAFMNYHKGAINLIPAILIVLLFQWGFLEGFGFIKEFRNVESRFYSELVNHLTLALRAVTGAVILGVPAGILAWKRSSFSPPVFTFVNAMQTIPSLALFGLLIAPLAFLSREYPVLREMGLRGVGRTPALIALTLYALLPIVRNTYTSMKILDRNTLEAGKGMGMTPRQLFWKVEFPLSIPLILSGIRVSLVQTTGNTTVAALVGAGGLGYFVFRGLEQAAVDMIIMGVIPIIFLVLIIDKLLEILIRQISPAGLEKLYDKT